QCRIGARPDLCFLDEVVLRVALLQKSRANKPVRCTEAGHGRTLPLASRKILEEPPMPMTRALSTRARLLGAVALSVVVSVPAWSQTTTEQASVQGGTEASTGQQAAVVVDPIIVEARRKLAEPARGGTKVDRADRTALAAFYAARNEGPLWVTA